MSSWKSYTILHKKKNRRELGMMLIEGARLCKEAVFSSLKCEEAFVTEDFQQSEYWPEIEAELWKKQVEVRTIDERSLKKLAETNSPQGIIAVMHIPQLDLNSLEVSDTSLFLMLDGVRDPGNAGTLIRTAEWFGASAVLLADSVDPWNGKVLRSAMGSSFRLPVLETNVEDAFKWFADRQIETLAAVLKNAVDIKSAQINFPAALILGSEAHGLSAVSINQSNQNVRIAGSGKAESLNVAVAGGVFLDHLTQRLRKG